VARKLETLDLAVELPQIDVAAVHEALSIAVSSSGQSGTAHFTRPSSPKMKARYSAIAGSMEGLALLEVEDPEMLATR
jgi:hypothetical protein